jgi:DeoR/GlpR family transcriptional regulator of sugar metabolism
MLTYERQSHIIQFIQQRRSVSVSVKELSDQFNVSSMTIRRDLDALEKRGLVVRVHGGVIVPKDPASLREEVRAAMNMVQKSNIAEAAARLVKDGQTIFIDAGTTTVELVKRLKDRRGLTIVTNSLKVLYTLAESPGINLIGLGGAVFGGAWSFVGPLAETAIRHFHSDLAFLGIASLSLEHGLTEVNYFEGDIKSLIIKQSQRVVLLADSSKFEKVSPHSVAPLSDIDVIITDNHLPEELAAAYRKTGIELILAKENEALTTYSSRVAEPTFS